MLSPWDATFDLKMNLGPVILLLLFFAFKNILVLLARYDSGELRCPATALIEPCFQRIPFSELISSFQKERSLQENDELLGQSGSATCVYNHMLDAYRSSRLLENT